jgi:hypothetical protein
MLRSPPWLGRPLWNICVINDHGYVPLVVNTSRSSPHSRLVTGFATRLTWRVPLVEQEQLSLSENLSSSPVFNEVRITRSLAVCVCFVDRCLSFCTFSFAHCVVCCFSIYGFWLPLWYLQTLLAERSIPVALDCPFLIAHSVFSHVYYNQLHWFLISWLDAGVSIKHNGVKNNFKIPKE